MQANEEPRCSSTLRVEVTRACVGSGLCEGLDPEHFSLGPNNKAEVRDVESADAGEMRDVADCCPSGAIVVSED